MIFAYDWIDLIPGFYDVCYYYDTKELRSDYLKRHRIIQSLSNLIVIL